MRTTVFIYTISCPLTGFVRYVGKTANPKERFRKHLSAKLKSAGSLWIFSLRGKGMKPVFEIIDEVSIDDWQNEERRYIKLFRSIGASLLNHTVGGEGGDTMSGRKLTLDQAKKISLSKIGKPCPHMITWNKSTKGIKVDQFRMDGTFVATHNSTHDAARFIKRSQARIWFMVTGNGKKKINHVGGFVFKKHVDEANI